MPQDYLTENEQLAKQLQALQADVDAEKSGRPRVLQPSPERAADPVSAQLDALMAEVSTEPKGFGTAVSETIGKPFRMVPFAGAASDAWKAGQLYLDAKAMERGEATVQQEDRVRAFIADSQRPHKWGYTVGTIISELPAYAGEFALTGPAYRAGAGLTKAALGKLVGEAVESGVEKAGFSAVARIATKAASAVGGAAVQTAVGMPHRVLEATFRAALPKMGIQADEAGRASVVFEGTTRDFLDALPEGLSSQVIENLSERTGGVVEFIPGIAKVRALQLKVMQDWLGAHPGQGVSGFLKRVGEEAGWHGVLGEWLEERIGSAMHGLNPLEKTATLDQVWPGWKQATAELVAFSVPGAVETAASAAEGRAAAPQPAATGAESRPQPEVASAEARAEVPPGTSGQVPVEPPVREGFDVVPLGPDTEHKGDVFHDPETNSWWVAIPKEASSGERPPSVRQEPETAPPPQESGAEGVREASAEPSPAPEPTAGPEPAATGGDIADRVAMLEDERRSASQQLSLVGIAQREGRAPALEREADRMRARIAEIDAELARLPSSLQERGALSPVLEGPGSERRRVAEGIGTPETAGAFPWERPSETPPTSFEDTLGRPEWRARLRAMFEEGAGQFQRGGEIVEQRSGERLRQPWAPMSEWWDRRPRGFSKDELGRLLDRLEATPEGRAPRLSSRQADMLEYMLRNVPEHLRPEPTLAGGELPPEPGMWGDPTGGQTPEAVPRSARAQRPAEPVSAAPPLTPVGGRLLGHLEPVEPPKKGQRVTPMQVVDSYAQILRAAGSQATIRWGRMGRIGKRARGLFKVQEAVIRVKEAYNLATAAHEVGHALEKAVFGWVKGTPWKSPLVGKRIQDELSKLGHELYGSVRPAAGYRREGWAEFVRLWTSEPQNVRSKAPLLTEWFERSFLQENPELRPAFDEARKVTTKWREQGSVARNLASIVSTGTIRAQNLKAYLRRALSLTAWVESNRAMQKIAEAAGEARGTPLPDEENPYLAVSSLAASHIARANYMVEHGMIDATGQKVGPSLAEIKALVRGKRADFEAYLRARRAISLATDPITPGRSAGLSIEDAVASVKQLETPEFQLAAQKVYDWQDGVLDYVSQLSPAMAEQVKQIRGAIEARQEVDPNWKPDYVPLQRYFEPGEDVRLRRPGAGGVNPQLTQRLKGSGRPVVSPFEHMISNAQRMILAAHQRVVIDKLLALRKIEDFGHILEEVPRDQLPAAQRSVAELVDSINRSLRKEGAPATFSLVDPTGREIEEVLAQEAKIDPAGAAERAQDLIDFMSKTITLFEPARDPKGVDPVIPFVEDGKVKWIRVPEALYRSLMGLDPYRLPTTMNATFGALARLKRMGTTGLRAAFSLYRNPIKDFPNLYLNSRSRAGALSLFFNWWGSLGRAALRTATGGRYTDPYDERMIALGIEMAQSLTQDARPTERVARRVFQGRVGQYLDPRNAFDILRQVLQFPETASRATEFRLLAKEIGWKPGEPMTEAQAQYLLLASKEVTTNFTAAGTASRAINQAVPFFNAAIQGPRANIRAFRRNPTRFLFRAAQLAAVSLYLWWKYKDELWYREMPADQRFGNWHIPIDGPEKTLLRIPKPFDVGAMFASLPEVLADAAYRRDPELAREAFGQFFRTILPDIAPPPVQEAIDQLSNRDSYTGAPIVPMSEERRAPEEQAGPYSSRAGVAIGRVLGWSPRRIDHAIRAIGGGAASDLVEALGVGPPERPAEKSLADIPIFGTAFQRGGQLGQRPRSISLLYHRLEAAERRQASFANPETEDERRERLLLTDAAKAVTAILHVRQATPRLEDQSALTAEALEIARDALQAGASGERGAFARARRRAERREEELKKERLPASTLR